MTEDSKAEPTQIPEASKTKQRAKKHNNTRTAKKNNESQSAEFHNTYKSTKDNGHRSNLSSNSKILI